MADIMKKFIGHMEGVHKARVFDAAAKAMAEHCDKRIAKALRALAREEERLLKSSGPAPGGTGVTRRQIKQTFVRLHATLSAGDEK